VVATARGAGTGARTVGTAPQLTISRYGLRKSIVVARRESDHTFQLSDACVKINFGWRRE